MQEPTAILAQSQQDLGRVFFWLLMLIGIVVLAAAGVLYLRKWYTSSDSEPAVGFTLGDIRQLHRDGQMTDEEFERAKALILGRTRQQLHQTPDPTAKNDQDIRDVKLGE